MEIVVMVVNTVIWHLLLEIRMCIDLKGVLSRTVTTLTLAMIVVTVAVVDTTIPVVVVVVVVIGTIRDEDLMEVAEDTRIPIRMEVEVEEIMVLDTSQTTTLATLKVTNTRRNEATQIQHHQDDLMEVGLTTTTVVQPQPVRIGGGIDMIIVVMNGMEGGVNNKVTFHRHTTVTTLLAIRNALISIITSNNYY